MQRNLRLYPWYQALANLLFWLPVFFLYFSSLVPPAAVLLLEAIYYVSAVALEVPSGWLSDRAGRRPTLIAAAACWIAAGVTFALADGFAALAVAQVLLAAGMAFNSGTDSSLLYDSLLAEGRESEIAQHEARAQAAGFYANAGAALVGGLVAGLWLGAPYVLGAIGAAGAFAVVLAMREPPVDRTHAHPPLRQVGACIRRLGNPVLAWLFVFAVGMVVFNHVPYEFIQPWLDLLLAGTGGTGPVEFTPPVAGLILAGIMLLAAVASRIAVPLRDRLGVPGTLLATMLLQGAIIVGMAVWLHPLIIPLLLFRSVPRAIGTPLINATVHPRVDSSSRATYLSLQSFAGRLAFAASLTACAAAVADADSLSHADLAGLLTAFAIMLGGLAAGLGLVARFSHRVRNGFAGPRD